MRKYLIIFFVFGLTSLVAQNNANKQLAIEYYKAEKYEKAVVKFKELYKKSPADEYYNYLKTCYLSLEDYAAAEAITKKHIKKTKGRNGPFYIDLGYIQKKSGKEKEALESFNIALELVSKNPNLAYGISKRFTEYGLNKWALRAYEVAEENNPNMVFHYQKALIYAELGDLENMYLEYLNMVEQNPSYYNTVQNMLQYTINQDDGGETNALLKELLIERIQKDDNVLFSNLLVWLLIQEKNYGQAFIQLKSLDKRLERNQSEIYHLGTVCMKSKSWDDAQKCFSYILKVGELSPYYDQAMMQSLFARQQQLEDDVLASTKDYELLIEDYKKTIDLIYYPEDVLELKQNMAHIMAFKLNEAQKAVTLLKDAVENSNTKDAGVAPCKLELGDILLSFGDSWEALMYYAQVDKSFPEGEMGQEARFKKAMIAFYQGDFDWAKAQFDILKTSTTKFIANDAMRMSILISDNTYDDEDSTFMALQLFAKAKLFVIREDLDSANLLLDTIAASYPGHSLQDEILFEKASIYQKQGKIDLTIETLKKLIEFYPEEILVSESLYILARIYELNKMDVESAMAYYEILFTEHGDSLFSSQARDAYRRLRGDELYAN